MSWRRNTWKPNSQAQPACFGVLGRALEREERIAKPDYNKLSRSELVLAEVLEYDQAKRAQQKKDMDLPPEEELEDVHDDGEEGSDETVED